VGCINWRGSLGDRDVGGSGAAPEGADDVGREADHLGGLGVARH